MLFNNSYFQRRAAVVAQIVRNRVLRASVEVLDRISQGLDANFLEPGLLRRSV